MGQIRDRSPFAGQVVRTKQDVGLDPLTKAPLGGKDFWVEDWWENVSGKSWMNSDGNPAALAYAFRTGMSGGKVPINNEVLYGKIDGLGFMFNVCELELPEVI